MPYILTAAAMMQHATRAQKKPPEARFAEGQAITPRPAGVDLEAMKTALMIAVNSDHSCQQYKQSDAGSRKPQPEANTSHVPHVYKSAN